MQKNVDIYNKDLMNWKKSIFRKIYNYNPWSCIHKNMRFNKLFKYLFFRLNLISILVFWVFLFPHLTDENRSLYIQNQNRNQYLNYRQ